MVPPKPVVQTPPPPPVVSPEQVQAQVAKLLENVPCTFLSASLTYTGTTGTLTITGLTGAGAPRDTLTNVEQSLPGNLTISDQVQSLDGPYCDTFRAIKAFNPIFGGNQLQLALTGGDRVLHNNDDIAITEQMPPGATNFALDYYQDDGTVVHLQKPKLKPDQTTLTQDLGSVSAPYGTDLLVSVVSSTPLFTAARKQQEQDSAYLPALNQALQSAQATGAQVYVSAIPVATAP